MRKRLKWISMVFFGLWLFGCSHSPGPPTKVAQQPVPQPSTQATATGGAPVVVVAETEFDFGVVEDSGEYVHDFKIANKGDGILEIKKVLPA